MLRILKDDLFLPEYELNGFETDIEKIKNSIGFSIQSKTIGGTNYLKLMIGNRQWKYVDVDLLQKVLDKEVELEEFISFNNAAKKLGISIHTLNRWYRWYRNRMDENLKNKVPPLPPPVTIGRVKHFYLSAFEDLKRFKSFFNSHRGLMRNETRLHYTPKTGQQYGHNKDY